jgi:hypothetical protein
MSSERTITIIPLPHPEICISMSGAKSVQGFLAIVIIIFIDFYLIYFGSSARSTW